MKLMRAVIMRDMDRLEHDKEHGFYDRTLDLYFECLNQWAQHKYGVKLADYHI